MARSAPVLCLTATALSSNPADYFGHAAYALLIAFVGDRPDRDRYYTVDITKIQAQLGWQPSVTPDQSVQSRLVSQPPNWWAPPLG